MRPSDWNAQVSQLMKKTMDKPFRRGVNDCVTHVADAVILMSGIDIIAEGRGYKSKEAGIAIMNEYGCKSLADIVDRHFEREPHHRRLKKGDIVYRKTSSGETLGLLWDQMKVYLRAENGGFEVSKLQRADIGWSIDKVKNGR